MHCDIKYHNFITKIKFFISQFAMLGAYNNTVKNPDPEKIVKQISTMLSQHSVIHAVTIQIL